jgi:hypothetical protein
VVKQDLRGLGDKTTAQQPKVQQFETDRQRRLGVRKCLLFELFISCLCCFVCYSYCFVVVLFYVLFVCKCVLYHCLRVATQLQLSNISYLIIELLAPMKPAIRFNEDHIT